MITLRLKTLFLSACILEAAWLLVAQTLHNEWLLFPCLVCFLVLVGWSAVKGMAMPIMLFFLPFAPLLKIDPDSLSFYTIALLLVYAVCTITSSRNVRIYHLVPALCLTAFVLVVKTAYGYEIGKDFIMFAIALMLVPFIVREMDDQYSFFWLTLFFVFGIGLAASTANYLAAFPTIARYINVDAFLGITRRSGYYSDPNFYSTHVTAALSGVLMLFLHNDQKRKLVALVPMMMVLLYCGFMSVSKMFFLIGACIILLWFMDLLFRKGKISVKITLILTLLVAFLFLLSSTIFSDMLDMILSRFSQDSSLSEFTTGRTELWANHLNAIFSEPLLLLFGKGYVNVVIVGTFASHNTFIQCLTQFGLVGGALFLVWCICYGRVLLGDAKVRWNNISQLAILAIGVFGPWMALDYLFIDDMFLLPIYFSAAIRMLSQSNETNKLLVNEKRGINDEYLYE